VIGSRELWSLSTLAAAAAAAG